MNDWEMQRTYQRIRRTLKEVAPLELFGFEELI